MALSSIPIMRFPSFVSGSRNKTDVAWTPVAQTCDASGEGVATILYPPKTGTISKIKVYIPNSLSPVLTLRAGIYAVNTSTGLPDTSTVFGSMVAVTENNPAFGWKTYTLLTGCTISSVATPIAVVTDLTSFTSATQFTIGYMSSSRTDTAIPYVCVNTGSWAKSSNYGYGHVVLVYSDDSVEYLPGTVTYNASGSSPPISTNEEYALKFTVPFTCRVVGYYINQLNTTYRDLEVYLYDNSDNVLASRTGDTSGNIHSGRPSSTQGIFSSTATVDAGTVVRLSIKNKGGSTSYNMIDCGDDEDMSKQIIGGNYSDMSSSNGNPGSWTDTASEYPMFSLLIDQIDAGGSGYKVNPGMSGGMSG